MADQGIDRTVAVFYRTARAGASRLSDGGGPFGFDIAVALLADEVIAAYGCDAIAETGCFFGDTTDHLARRYPELPLYTCDIEPVFASFTAHRLARHPVPCLQTGRRSGVGVIAVGLESSVLETCHYLAGHFLGGAAGAVGEPR